MTGEKYIFFIGKKKEGDKRVLGVIESKAGREGLSKVKREGREGRVTY